MAKIVNYKDVLTQVIKIWMACYGAITFPVVAGYFMSHLLLPYLGFALIALIMYMAHRNYAQSTNCCSLMIHYTVYILAVSSLLMLVANLLNTHFITNRFSEFSHKDYPFHTAFIVYPIAALIYGIAVLRRGKPQYCMACRTTSEFSIAEALRRNVLHHESKVQIRLAFALSLALSLMAYIYYVYFYSSDMPGRRHTPDAFFLYILPAASYVISSIYIFTRFMSTEFEISLNMAQDSQPRASRVRFMVIWRDQLLLKDIVGGGLSGLWDTPADLEVSPVEDIPIWEAERAFRRFYGSDRFTLKRLFATSGRTDNYLHCAAFLDDDDDNVNAMGGEWFKLREVDFMLKSGVIARPFAIEMHRIFTITMAWKTYDRDGKRLYPIKNYRPTFRLRDFKDWDVDYEDVHWLSVSNNNQDKPFYHLKRLWLNITGTERRWQKRDS